MNMNMSSSEMKEFLAGYGPCTIVMVGCSGSGKSTLIQRIAPEHAHTVSTDDLRGLLSGDVTNQEVSREAFFVAHKIIEERSRYQQTTFLDATSTSSWARGNAIKRSRSEHGDFPVLAIVVMEPLEVCLDRNAQRDRNVPEEVIEKQHKALWKELDSIMEEGFTEVFRYTSYEDQFQHGSLCFENNPE